MRLPRPSIVWRLRLVLAVVLIGANLIGAIVVFHLAALILPLPAVADAFEVRIVNLVAAAIYVTAAVLLGVVVGWRWLLPLARWLRADRDPDDSERRQVLRLPWQFFLLHAVLWGAGAVIIGVLNSTYELALGWRVALIVALGGASTSAMAYLLAERLLRPVASRALASGVPDRLAVRSVTVRVMFAWILGTGVSVLGLVLVGFSILVGSDASANQLAITMVALGGLALGVGSLSAFVAAKASSDPVRSVRTALARVERGDLDVEVPIYDGTEIGLLQAGFNRMVEGLREREEIRDLFGRHVGEDVARAALDRGVELGGEVRDVAVLFVDLVGSTTLAADRPPDEVVTVLNRFFAVVVEVVEEHGGWVNKFEGDAALAIWGAPVPVDDRDTRVLAAARVMGERLEREISELRAGVGVSGGAAVAGNVGAARRFEYTVIGDPVNEAARLTELAKSVPGFVVANAELVDRASPDEAARWEGHDEVTLRGRTAATRVAAPIR